MWAVFSVKGIRLLIKMELARPFAERIRTTSFGDMFCRTTLTLTKSCIRCRMTYERYTQRVSSAFGMPNWIPYSMLSIRFGTRGLQFLLNISRPPEKDAKHQSYV